MFSVPNVVNPYVCTFLQNITQNLWENPASATKGNYTLITLEPAMFYCVGIWSFTKVTESRPQASRQHSYFRIDDHYLPGIALHTAFAWSRQSVENCAGSLVFLRIPENMQSYQWPCCFTWLHLLPGSLIMVDLREFLMSF